MGKNSPNLPTLTEIEDKRAISLMSTNFKCYQQKINKEEGSSEYEQAFIIHYKMVTAVAEYGNNVSK
jgi:hypothetical protein